MRKLIAFAFFLSIALLPILVGCKDSKNNSSTSSISSDITETSEYDSSDISSSDSDTTSIDETTSKSSPSKSTSKVSTIASSNPKPIEIKPTGVNKNIIITDMRVENYTNPVGIPTDKPRFSFVTTGPIKSVKAYRILVASKKELLTPGKADLWDSQYIGSSQTFQITYGGKPLASAKEYFWSVAVIDENNLISNYSAAASFETGLLKPSSDFKGKWITTDIPVATKYSIQPAPQLRKEFTVSKKIAKARLYTCGLGVQNIFINGQRAIDKELSPYNTLFDRVVYYDTLDVTKFIKTGNNAIGYILGNGHFNAFNGEAWSFNVAPWIDKMKLLMQLEITYTDGSIDRIVSDQSFKFSSSPVVYNEIRAGEIYDARLEQKGWDQPGFNDKDWKPALLADPPGDKIKGTHAVMKGVIAEPIRKVQEIKPVKVTKLYGNSGYTFDFGVNLVGFCKLNIKNPTPGQEISLLHGEEIRSSGTVTIDKIRAFAPIEYIHKDVYICRGDSVETWQPAFNYHGFRYVQVKGITEEQVEGLLTACVVNSDLRTAGTLTTSDSVLNKVQEITLRSTIGNFYYFQTDCPTREKNGWIGDISLSVEHTLSNFDAGNSYENYMETVRYNQKPSGGLPGVIPAHAYLKDTDTGPTWNAVIINVPYFNYKMYGNKKIILDNINAIENYIFYVSTVVGDDGLEPKNPSNTSELGDWCPPHSDDPGGYKCPVQVTSTAVQYDNVMKAAEMFDLVGKAGMADYCRNLGTKMRNGFRKHLIDMNTMTVKGNTQTGQAVGIFYGMFNEGAERTKAEQVLVNMIKANKGLADCGVNGNKVIYHVLSKSKNNDLAVSAIKGPDYPSFGYCISKGATTLWEDFKGLNSLNHHFFGDVSYWMYKELVGIDQEPDSVAFQKLLIKPSFATALTSAKATRQTPYGTVNVEWKKSGNNYQLKFTVPVSCTAKVVLPDGYKFVGTNQNTKTYTAGSYTVDITK